MNKLLLPLLLNVWLSTCVSAQTLDSLRADLRRANPELRALLLDYQAATYIGAQQTQLPDLELGLGVFLLPVETRTGPQRLRLGATQMLPWPGKLAAMNALADAKARPLLEQRAARQLLLLFQLDQAYYSLAGVQARTAVLQESLPRYASLKTLALRRIENGLGSTVDVYRLQLRELELERQLEQLRFLAQQEMVSINTLLQRPADTQVDARVDLDGRVAETLDFAPDLAADDPDLSQHPALRLFSLQQAANQAALTLTDLEQKPDFGVGIDYLVVSPRSGMTFDGNGRDIIMPRATVVFPLSKGKFTAKREEEAVRIQALATRQDATETEFRAELRRALNAINNAANQLYYLREQLRTLEAALAAASNEYANGQRPFDELLQLENMDIELRTQVITAQATILNQRAIIDRYFLIQQ